MLRSEPLKLTPSCRIIINLDLICFDLNRLCHIHCHFDKNNKLIYKVFDRLFSSVAPDDVI